MIKKFARKTYYMSGAALSTGMVMGFSSDAMAGGAGAGFNDIARNIAGGTSDIPGLIASLAYLVGALLAVLGIMKIKDHVENPTQTPLKDGAIRLAAGGGLFAMPTIMDAMLTTLGTSSGSVVVPTVNSSGFTIGN